MKLVGRVQDSYLFEVSPGGIGASASALLAHIEHVLSVAEPDFVPYWFEREGLSAAPAINFLREQAEDRRSRMLQTLGDLMVLPVHDRLLVKLIPERVDGEVEVETPVLGEDGDPTGEVEKRVVKKPVANPEMWSGLQETRLVDLADTAQDRPQEAEVLAVGSGRVMESGQKVALDVRVGDHVLFGKYNGVEVKIKEKTYLCLREEELLVVLRRGAAQPWGWQTWGCDLGVPAGDQAVVPPVPHRPLVHRAGAVTGGGTTQACKDCHLVLKVAPQYAKFPVRFFDEDAGVVVGDVRGGYQVVDDLPNCLSADHQGRG